MKNQQIITSELYKLSEDYFKEIMIDLGYYLMKRYHVVDDVPITELFSQIIYINDLTIHQKVYLCAWLAKNQDEYEGIILRYLNEKYD